MLLKIAPLLFLLVSCFDKKVPVNFKVDVKTNQGDPVAGASVKLEGTELGTTDSKGHFEKATELEPKSRQRIEVTKQSDAYYFAPFYESFAVQDGGTQEVKVASTLYFVPKPKPDGSVAAQPTASSPLPPATTEVAPPAPSPETAKTPTDAPTEEQLITTESLAPATPAEPAPATSATEPDAGDNLFTVHVYSKNSPVSDAEVLTGNDEAASQTLACKTNERGRCAFGFVEKSDKPVVIVVQKPGFSTVTKKVKLTDGGSQRVNLDTGETIEIFALSKSYSHSRGLPGVEVLVKNQKIGETDEFGRLSYIFTGPKNDLVSISLRSSAYLPENYETDFVVTGPMTLTRYFAPATPPPVRIAVMKVQPSGQVDPQDLNAFDGVLDTNLRKAIGKELFTKVAFKEIPLESFGRMMNRAKLNPSGLMKRGWLESDMRGEIDAVMIPTVSMQGKFLELSVIDGRGKVLTAAKSKLDSIYSENSVDRAVTEVTRNLARTFPFEGAVLNVKGQTATINLGTEGGRTIRNGDRLDLFGIQTGVKGRTQEQTKIATLQVASVAGDSAETKIMNLSPRAVVNRGDLVVLRAKPDVAPKEALVSEPSEITGNAPSIASAAASRDRGISVATTGSGNSPVAQANVYLDDRWLGATDDSGNLSVTIKGKGTLRVVKHGFATLTQEAKLDGNSQLKVKLTPESAFLRVDSNPSGATVKIDGKVLGKTPLNTPMAVPAGFVKLELEGVSGYKLYSNVLDLDQGTLDLTGANSIALELDLLTAIKKMVAAGNITDAIAKLVEFPREHSDFLLARHELGDLYLGKLNEPAKAAAAFNEITQHPTVKQFTDKRFISSHINEGIALFLTGERLFATGDVEIGKEHMIRAVAVLDGVSGQTRFIAKDQYAAATHNLEYYRSLARHRLWVATKDPVLLSDAVRGWKQYLDGIAKSVPISAEGKSFVENASVYYKQAQASLNSTLTEDAGMEGSAR